MQIVSVIVRIFFLLLGTIIFLGGVWTMLSAWGSKSAGLAILGLLELAFGLVVGYLGSRLAKRWLK
jgi:hypothetical protein